MKAAVHQIEEHLGEESEGVVLLSGADRQLMVMRGGVCVDAVPLTTAEFDYIEKELGDPHRLRPLVYFHLALLRARVEGL